MTRNIVTNKQIISWFKKQDQMRVELKAKVRELTKLSEAIDALGSKVDAARRVSEIYKGVALYVMGNRIMASADDENRRGGYWYRHATNNEWYGINAWEDTFGRQGDKCTMYAAHTEEEAITLLKEWVVTGVRPVSKV